MEKIKYILLVVFISGLVHSSSYGQESKNLNLKNVLVVAQQDKISDRYSLEIALIQLLNQYKVKSKASLNVVKQEGSIDIIESDSIQKQLQEEGIDTYLLVSVRGFDNRFKPSAQINDFGEELKAGHLFPLYRDGASRVTFSFIFYRDNKPVHYELIRTGTIGSKDAVIKKLIKKVEKRLVKSWL